MDTAVSREEKDVVLKGSLLPRPFKFQSSYSMYTSMACVESGEDSVRFLGGVLVDEEQICLFYLSAG